jgi:hypothetical protein
VRPVFGLVEKRGMLIAATPAVKRVGNLSRARNGCAWFFRVLETIVSQLRSGKLALVFGGAI